MHCINPIGAATERRRTIYWSVGQDLERLGHRNQRIEPCWALIATSQTRNCRDEASGSILLCRSKTSPSNRIVVFLCRVFYSTGW